MKTTNLIITIVMLHVDLMNGNVVAVKCKYKDHHVCLFTQHMLYLQIKHSALAGKFTTTSPV